VRRMRARVLSWVGGVGCMLGATSANAQTAAVQFPPEPAAVTAPAAPETSTATPQAPTGAPATQAATPVAPTTQPGVVPAPARQPAIEAAPESDAPTRPKAPRDWNVGAGIMATGDGFNMFFSRGMPLYHAALERRVGEHTWFAFNARAGYDTDQRLASTLSISDEDTATIDMATASILLGARQVFVEGLVEVSGYAAIMAGYHDVMGDELAATGATAILGGGDGYDLGLLLGVAVERELIDALALRLALDLVSARISTEEASKRDETGKTHTTPLTSGRAALNVQPSLQLHFYF
jgi:hypothetical protein